MECISYYVISLLLPSSPFNSPLSGLLQIFLLSLHITSPSLPSFLSPLSLSPFNSFRPPSNFSPLPSHVLPPHLPFPPFSLLSPSLPLILSGLLQISLLSLHMFFHLTFPSLLSLSPLPLSLSPFIPPSLLLSPASRSPGHASLHKDPKTRCTDHHILCRGQRGRRSGWSLL